MTIRNRLTIVLLALAVAAFVGAIPAQASGGGTAVLADCNAHDALTKSYTVAELRNALATMPATMREYTDCQDVISRALNTALGTGGKNNGAGPSSSSGGSSLSTGVIVVIVVLVLAAASLGAIAIRRRRAP